LSSSPECQPAQNITARHRCYKARPAPAPQQIRSQNQCLRAGRCLEKVMFGMSLDQAAARIDRGRAGGKT